MREKISQTARAELLGAIRSRYIQATKKDKGKILDELAALVGCHRKHAIRMFSNPTKMDKGEATRGKR